tara:strand:- start:5940 stop:6746 length:807 start_codon:yes stop_codon:yes gene_type:complete
MKVTIITGDHPRHLYLVDRLSEMGLKIHWILEKREKHIQTPSDELNSNLKKLFKIHFEKRQKAEYDFFTEKSGELAKSKINNITNVNEEDFSNGKLKKIISSNLGEILITYGCHLIPDEILNLIKLYKWNVHGGLSPWYRGNATHYWPSYLLEPEYTGMTLHELTSKIDGGDIVHQTSVEINKNDGIHENACRTVKEFCDDLPALLKKGLSKQNRLELIPQHTTGKLWTKSMWSPSTLKVIYELFEDKINKYCIENKKIKKPKLVSAL